MFYQTESNNCLKLCTISPLKIHSHNYVPLNPWNIQQCFGDLIFRESKILRTTVFDLLIDWFDWSFASLIDLFHGHCMSLASPGKGEKRDARRFNDYSGQAYYT